MVGALRSAEHVGAERFFQLTAEGLDVLDDLRSRLLVVGPGHFTDDQDLQVGFLLEETRPRVRCPCLHGGDDANSRSHPIEHPSSGPAGAQDSSIDVVAPRREAPSPGDLSHQHSDLRARQGLLETDLEDRSGQFRDLLHVHSIPYHLEDIRAYITGTRRYFFRHITR